MPVLLVEARLFVFVAAGIAVGWNPHRWEARGHVPTYVGTSGSRISDVYKAADLRPLSEHEYKAPTPNTQHPAPGQTICIDPGHPSEVGKGSKGKALTEIKVDWLVAKKLKSILEQDGYRVVLTKSRENQFVKNKDRADIANKSNASLLLRLHCDSGPGSGFAVYYPDREGMSGKVRGPSKEVIEKSTEAGKLVHEAMATCLKDAMPDRGLYPDVKTLVGSRQGALTGSIYSKVPVVLVEMCDLSEKKDEEFMNSEEGRTKMANALAAGVRAVVKQAGLN